jgi:hypothetical protein
VISLLAALFLLLAGGCDQPGPLEPRGSAPPSVERQQAYGQSTQSLRQRQAAFLNEIRQADPSYRTIEKAVINENNELGLIVTRNVEMDSIPALMRSILTRMAKQFPGQDLTVIAYAPSNPPMKIGTARLDAQSRQMTYTATQR